MSDIVYEAVPMPPSPNTNVNVEEIMNGFIVHVRKNGVGMSYVVENIEKRDNVAVLLGIIEEALERKSEFGEHQ